MPDQFEASMLQKVVKMMIDHGDNFEKAYGPHWMASELIIIIIITSAILIILMIIIMTKQAVGSVSLHTEGLPGRPL